MMQDYSKDKSQVYKLFDEIAPRYDIANRILSLKKDMTWRRKMVKELPTRNQMWVLDLATGTADIPIVFLRHSSRIEKFVGIDPSKKMLEVAKLKVLSEGMGEFVQLLEGRAEDLSFLKQKFDAVTMGFGIRNVVNVDQVLTQILGVLKTGGRAIILEFSIPHFKPLKGLYLFYLRHILPFLGGLISGSPSAYRYLNETVETFPQGNEFLSKMKKVGFTDLRMQRLTLGIATIYSGSKF
jgi:demethylmenaquinone methyltransferase/2-methoxy-6-polyprenyl-1,4-benzoquinol methylase